jgi:hypothetical protein
MENPEEAEAVRRFGEPTIDVGGEFDDGDALTYTLAADDRKFPSQFPVKKIFSLEDYTTTTNDRAVLFRDTIRTRITDAITDLRAQAVGSTGREISNIDTTPTP